MSKKTRRMALCGMMTALGTTIMLLGGAIPAATFCCPMLATLTLLPILAEYGQKWTAMAWGAIAILSLFLCPDKEAALLMLFLGHYPALKPTLDRIRMRPARIAAKLGVFNLAAAAMLATIVFVLNLTAIWAEYQAMGLLGGVAFLLAANFTMLMYDRVLVGFFALYLKKLRPILMKG